MSLDHDGPSYPRPGRYMLRSKLHRVIVTGADLDCEGSLTLDARLLRAGDVLPFEEIHVWNVTRATRFRTYAMADEAGSGTVCVNGAAAQLAGRGDVLIVSTFTFLDEEGTRRHRPRIVLVGEDNRILERVVEVPGPASRAEKLRPGTAEGMDG